VKQNGVRARANARRANHLARLAGQAETPAGSAADTPPAVGHADVAYRAAADTNMWEADMKQISKLVLLSKSSLSVATSGRSTGAGAGRDR